MFEGVVPGGCAFWERAAQGAFATTTSDHALCAIGVHTHNLADPSSQVKSELAAVLAVMADLDYVREEDVARIPVLERSPRVVVYAPLADCPIAPDAVVLFARADHSLILSEAAEMVDGTAAPAMGRPACAMIPMAVNSGRAVMSLGCCGARAYLDGLGDDVAMWTLPGARLAAYADRISSLARANATLATFHQLRRASVEAGERPTFEQSLGRMKS